MYKLSDVRELLEAALERPVSKQLAHKYTCARHAPETVLAEPIRLWNPDMVHQWIQENILPMVMNRPEEVMTDRDREVRAFILASGGITRQPAYWDNGITAAENRRAYAYLDRKGARFGLDELAQEIAEVFPDVGITDDDSLWAWLGSLYR